MHLTRDDLRRMAGEVIICGFQKPHVDSDLKLIMREVMPLGLITFARNVESMAQTQELNRELKSLRNGTPVMLSVDQEGGRVARLKQDVTRWPPLAHVGRHGDAEAARAMGQALGEQLRALGFDMNFAPVLDVNSNPKNPIIGDRSFSADAKVVGRLGKAMICGLQSAGVAACGKHFPGHGDTDLDSHLALPTLEHDLARLRAIEWPPFVSAIEADVAAIMTAHVLLRNIDDSIATVSRRLLVEHLRQELNFLGAIISDDIDMRALADHFTPEAMGPKALLAGVDVFLACNNHDHIMGLYRGIVLAAESTALPHQTLCDAAKRATALRQTYYRPASSKPLDKAAFIKPEHQQLADKLFCA